MDQKISLNTTFDFSQSMVRTTILKFLVFGEANVGKTTLCSRYLIDYFPEQRRDILESGIRRMIKFKDQHYEIELIDTQSQNQFFHLMKYQKIHGIIYMFSLNDLQTFKSIPAIREALFKTWGKHLPSIVIGNKTNTILNENINDQINQIRRKVCSGWKAKYSELSLKECKQQDLDKLIMKMVAEIHFQDFDYVNPNSCWNHLIHRVFINWQLVKFYVLELFLHLIIGIYMLVLGLSVVFQHAYYILYGRGSPLFFGLMMNGFLRILSFSFSLYSIKKLNYVAFSTVQIIYFVTIVISILCVFIYFCINTDINVPNDFHIQKAQYITLVIISIPETSSLLFMSFIIRKDIISYQDL